MAEVRNLEEVKLDDAYKFGCGRYLQGRQVLEKAAPEVRRVGKKPFLVAGKRAWASTTNRIEQSLSDADIDYSLMIYSGQTTYSKAKAIAKQARDENCDVIVGVGGGKIMDLAKAAAHFAKMPVLMVPTSIATCAAFAPLSVMYTAEGASLGSLRYEHEVNAILVDLDVIANAPARYIASGILDGMAKLIEIQNGRGQIDSNELSIGLLTSYTLAQYTTKLYKSRGLQACKDTEKHTLTKNIEDIAYLNIAVSGIISGCSKGFGQSALAHECYELIRTHFTKEAKDYLHGEIVALALPMQLSYNGQETEIPTIRSFMKQMNMPIFLPDIGIEATQQNLDILFKDLYNSPFVVRSEQNAEKLRKAMQYLIE